MYIVGQVFSILGMALTIFSMQLKKVERFYLCQILSNLAFTLSFLFLESMAGMIMNVFGFLRALILFLLGKKLSNNGRMIILMIAFVPCAVLSVLFETNIWIALIPVVAQLMGTIGMWTGNARKIRILQFCCVSPFWFVYNIFCMSIGGLICESFNMVSIIVSIIRFGWKSLGEEDAFHKDADQNNEEVLEKAV